MKKLFLLAVILLGSFAAKSEIVQQGNNFIEVRQEKKDEPTVYTYTDKNGKVYPIYKSSRGKYYIKKISKKTGKEYKQYLPREIQNKLCRY